MVWYHSVMKYKCPICNEEMSEYYGNGITEHDGDSKFGTFLACGNLKCTAQEVKGHANNVKNAYEVILQKYVARKDRD